jgi:hypothetical protein
MHHGRKMLAADDMTNVKPYNKWIRRNAIIKRIRIGVNTELINSNKHSAVIHIICPLEACAFVGSDRMVLVVAASSGFWYSVVSF